MSVDLLPTVCEVCGQPSASFRRDTRVIGQAPDKRGRMWDVLEPGDLHAFCKVCDAERYPEETEDNEFALLGEDD
jgi:hypothetical protein